ncbi:MAG: group II intron maturase-specific domain-containing protein [Clostridia bacterium]
MVVQDVNAFLRGWAAYFRIGNATRMFDKMMAYAAGRLAGFIAKRHRRQTRYGWRVLQTSPNRLGLMTLNGLVVALRPNRPWRVLVAAHRR